MWYWGIISALLAIFLGFILAFMLYFIAVLGTGIRIESPFINSSFHISSSHAFSPLRNLTSSRGQLINESRITEDIQLCASNNHQIVFEKLGRRREKYHGERFGRKLSSVCPRSIILIMTTDSDIGWRSLFSFHHHHHNVPVRSQPYQVTWTPNTK